nr:MAG TPA: hypothetical protein [Bacteriophage sp.]
MLISFIFCSPFIFFDLFRLRFCSPCCVYIVAY